MSARGSAYGVRIDYISDALIGIFLLTVLFAGLGGLIGSDQASFNLAVFMVLLQLSAIALWVLSKTYTVAPNVGSREFATDAKYIIAGLTAFFILNWVVPLTLPFAPPLSSVPFSLASGARFVTIMMAIPEESLFRGWAAPWFARRLGVLGGTILSGAAFTIYHLFVYSNNASALLIVFGAGVVAGFVVLKTRRLYTVLTMHFVANAIAVGIFR